MGFLRKILKKLRLMLLLPFLSKITPILRRKIKVRVMNVEETLNKIFKNRKTIIRFGDGELRLLLGSGETDFQKQNPELRHRLNEILREVFSQKEADKILICMPGVLSDCPREYSLGDVAKLFWFSFLAKNFNKLRELFESYPGLAFGDACFTRPYMDTQDREYAGKVFERSKSELKEKDVLIIEGRLSRFGVGNDLLSETKRVRRILGPEINAFNQYETLLERAKREKNVDVVILALGPAAKILAYDLTKMGFWCLDLGHLDIEYEWFRLKTNRKVVIKNKYVNESSKKFVGDAALDEVYENQIIFTCK